MSDTIFIPATHAHLDVMAGEKLAKGEKCRMLLKSSMIDEMAIGEGSRVGAACQPSAIHWGLGIIGTVEGMGKEFDRKGEIFRYAYVIADEVRVFARRDTRHDQAFDAAKKALNETGNIQAAAAAYDA